MKKEKFRSIESQEIVFPTPSGSIKLSTDQAGKITIGALTAPGVSEALVIDPINNEIFTSKIKFADGSSFDSAINLDDINIESAQVFLLKTNKIFFKYDTNGNPLPDQVITLKFDTSNIIDVNPSNISFVPAIEEPPILSGEGNTRTITVEQFELFNSNEVEISVTIGGITDSVTIYKVQDGVTYLQGGLSNPATFLQSTYDSSGNIFIENLSEILSLQGGKFYVFKDGQDVTNDPRITYRESTDDATTEGLTVSIDSDTGVYTITSFDPTKEIASATFEAVDSLSDQVLQSRYTISVVKQGIEGPEGPAGANGASGLDAKTVSISYTDGQIAYDSEGKNPVTNKKDENQNYIIEIEAEESSNHTSPVVYEFLVTEPGEAQATLQKGSSSKLILSNNTRTYTNSNFNTGYKFINDTKDAFGGGKIITVRTYENGSATPSAQDQTKIIATKDGSDSLTINLENASHSYPANPNSEGKFVVSQYTGGGSIVEVYFGNEELVGNLTAQTTEELQNGQFRVEIIDEDNIAAATAFEIKTKTINGTSVQYFYTGDPSNFGIDADVASITYLIVGKSSTGSVKSGLAKISYTKSKKGDKGETGSSGSSVKAVKLTSNDYQIAYSTNGTNPNPSSITLTAAASNHEGTVTYKFYKDSTEVSSGTDNTYTTPTTGEHSIPSTKFSKFVYSVKTFEGSTEIASDSITVFATKDGEGSVTVIVPNNNHTFNADSEGNVTSFAGGGSEIQVYFGNTECQGTTANSLTSNFSFRVSNIATSNVTFPDTPITAISNSKSLKLADPTALQGSNGTATLSIEVRADSSTTQTFTQVCSYNKSQDGKTALDEQIYSFSKTYNDNGTLRAFGWRGGTRNTDYSSYKGEFTFSSIGEVVGEASANQGGNVLKVNRGNSTTSGGSIYSDFIPIDINKTYILNFRAKQTTNTETTNFLFYLVTFDESKSKINESIFLTINNNAGTDWQERKFYITGQSTSNPTWTNGGSTHFKKSDTKNVKYVRLYMNLNMTNSNRDLLVDYFSIKEATANLDASGRTREENSSTNKPKIIQVGESPPSNPVEGDLINIIGDNRFIGTQYIYKSKKINFNENIPNIITTNSSLYTVYLSTQNSFFDEQANVPPPTTSDPTLLASITSLFSHFSYNTNDIGIVPYAHNMKRVDKFGAEGQYYYRYTNKFGLIHGLNGSTTNFTSGNITTKDYFYGKVRVILEIAPVFSTLNNGQDYWTTKTAHNNTNDYFGNATFSKIQLQTQLAGSSTFTGTSGNFYTVNNNTAATTEIISSTHTTSGTRFDTITRSWFYYKDIDINDFYKISYNSLCKSHLHSFVLKSIEFIGWVRNEDADFRNKLYEINAFASYGIFSFTGQHQNELLENEHEIKEGLIVSSLGKYNNVNYENHKLQNKPTIDESVPVVELTKIQNDKKIFGVISKKSENSKNNSFIFSSDGKKEKYTENRYSINSIGEGGIWVTNYNGNLENGDYITSSPIAGYGMKQDDDILRNYTVAKITCDCDFNLESEIYDCEEFEWEGQTYRRAFVGCTYHCG